MSNTDFQIMCEVDRFYAHKRKMFERYNELMLKPFLSALEQRELIDVAEEIENCCDIEEAMFN